MLSDIDEAGGAETLRLLKQAGGEGSFLPADVRDEAQVEAMVAQTVAAYGRLDCAVNNAGTEVTGAIADQTVANYTTLMDANVKGVFLCMKHEIRQMRQNGGGAIVNQSSVTSDIAGTPRNGLYATTKAAVLGLTKTAALEVAKDNISVNAIAAAAIDVQGDMIWQWIEQEGVTAEQIAAALPVGRMGRPEELVAAVLFLCSDTARFIVGQTLVLDGGFSVQ